MLQPYRSGLEGVSVAQAYYDRLQKEATVFSKQISGQMADARLLPQFEKQVLRDYLARKADEYGLGSVELFSSPRERSVVIVTSQYPPKIFTQTPADLVAMALAGQDVADVTGAKKGDIMRAVVPLYEPSGPGEGKRIVAAIAVSFYIPQNLAAKTASIREGYAQYRSAFSKKDPIKLSYRLGFLSVTLALLLAAIWVALRVAEGITVPIRKLAEGTAAVAAGRFDYHIDEKSEDEVGTLVAFLSGLHNLNDPWGDLVNWALVNHALQNVPGERYKEVQPGCGVWAPCYTHVPFANIGRAIRSATSRHRCRSRAR